VGAKIKPIFVTTKFFRTFFAFEIIFLFRGRFLSIADAKVATFLKPASVLPKKFALF
jgi:hypothetical protein